MTTPLDLRSFAGLLTDLRTRAGMTQSGLAAQAGCDHSYVCRLEAGKREPSRETVAMLADVLELDETDTGRLYVAAGYLPPGEWVWFQGWCIRPVLSVEQHATMKEGTA